MGKIVFIPFFLSDKETLRRLPREARGDLVIDLLEYADSGEIPDYNESDPLFYLWPIFQGIVDRHICAYEEKCRKAKENRSKAAKAAPKEDEDLKAQKELCKQKTAEITALFTGGSGGRG